jgi:hypothetical protein
MSRLVALVTKDVSKEPIASIIGVTKIGELESILAVTSKRSILVTASDDPSGPIIVTLIMEAKCSSETSVLTRATRRNIPEDGVLYPCFVLL